MKVSIRRIELGLYWALACWALACWAAACLGGCDKDEPERPPVEETIDAGEFCKLTMGAAQRNLESACSEAEQKEPAYSYLTGLAKERVTECTRWLEADAQRLTVPAKQARDCAAALDKQSWKELLLWRSVVVVPECRSMIVGKQKAGEACRSDAACVADHFCSGAREGSDGSCKPFVKAKESCEERSGTGMGWAARVSCAKGHHCVMENFKVRNPLGIDMPELREPEPVEADAGARGVALREAQEFGMIGLLNTGAADAMWHGIDRVVRGLEGETDPGSIGLGNAFGRLGGNARNVRMGALSVTGALPPEVVQRIVRQNFGRLRLCYEKALQKNDKLRGKLTARFEIDDKGAVGSAAVAGELKDDAFEKCLEQVFTGLSFPRPETGVVAVRIPLEFELPDKTEPPKNGTCHPALERCSHDGDCAEGTCQAGKCSAELAAAGGKCDDSSDCCASLYCKTGSCAARKKTGEPCTSSLQCAGICGKDDKCASFCD